MRGAVASIRDVLRSPALGRDAQRAILALIAIGTLVRIVVAFSTRGVPFDVDSYELARHALGSDPFNLYTSINTGDAPHWPYPPGFFAWLGVSALGNDLTGLRFDGFVQLAPIAADAALAWIVQAALGQRGASDGKRVAAAALIALGPTFGFISGYAAQLDALTILPAVVGFLVWTRSEHPQRAIVAGVLIGLGASIKLPALVVVLGLLPSARSVREGLTLGIAAAAVPFLLFVPWLIADPNGTVDAVRSNDGLPGFGGISLLVQPDLSALWLRTKPGIGLSDASQSLFDYASLIAVGALLLTTAVLVVRRAAPLLAVGAVWLAFYAFGVNFGLQYLIWGLPFLLLAGRVWEVFAIEAAVFIPTFLLYVNVWRDHPLQRIYTPIMLVVWAALVTLYLLQMRSVLRDRERPWPIVSTSP